MSGLSRCVRGLIGLVWPNLFPVQLAASEEALNIPARNV